MAAIVTGRGETNRRVGRETRTGNQKMERVREKDKEREREKERHRERYQVRDEHRNGRQTQKHMAVR